MQTCLDVNLIDRLLRGDLTEAEAEHVKAHLEACDKCRGRVDGERTSPLPGTPAAATPETDPASGAPPPRIPGYSLGRLMHRGGQGAVHDAVQDSTGRPVAVKLIHGRSKQELLRFEREVSLVGQLRHPNIVAMHDSGSVDDLCWIAMELVEGDDLDDWTTKTEPGLRERVRVFSAICAGVHHAHQVGVIHRDLKPKNIRVDSTGQPRVLDFGVAKPMAGSDLTDTGLFVGTVAYASPEQLSGERNLADARSDVYSLGVVLHELLTRRRWVREDKSPADAVRQVLDEEPVPPSRVDAIVDDDLDAIVLKALAKSPDERYQTVHALQSDIEAWLRGEAVEAKKHRTFYVLRKAFMRHRVAALVSAAFLMVLITATVVSARSSQRATQEAQRWRAVLEMTLRLFRAADPGSTAGLSEGSVSPGASVRDLTVRRFFEMNAARTVGQLPDDPLVRTEILRTLAETFLGVGLPKEARPLVAESVELERELGREQELIRSLVLQATVDTQLSDHEDARRALEEAHALSAFSQPLLRATVLQRMAVVAGRESRHDDAAAFAEEGLEELTRVPDRTSPGALTVEAGLQHVQAGLLQREGGPDDAAELLRELLERLTAHLPGDHHVIGLARGWLADALDGTGDLDQAIELMDALVSAQRSNFTGGHPELARTLVRASSLHMRSGAFDVGLELAKEAHAMNVELVGAESKAAAEAELGVGHCLFEAGKITEAEAAYRNVLDVSERRFGDGSDLTARAAADLGHVLATQRRFDEALPVQRRAVELMEIIDGGPSMRSVELTTPLVGSLLRLKHFDDAIQLSEEAFENMRRILDDELHPMLNATRTNLALTYVQAERPEKAIDLYEESLRDTEALGMTNQPSHATLLQGFAIACLRTDRLERAETLARECAEMYSQWLPAAAYPHAEVSSMLGEVLTRVGKFDEAVEHLEPAIPIIAKARGENHDRTELARDRLKAAREGAQR